VGGRPARPFDSIHFIYYCLLHVKEERTPKTHYKPKPSVLVIRILILVQWFIKLFVIPWHHIPHCFAICNECKTQPSNYNIYINHNFIIKTPTLLSTSPLPVLSHVFIKYSAQIITLLKPKSTCGVKTANTSREFLELLAAVRRHPGGSRQTCLCFENKLLIFCKHSYFYY
jgi:hypothetical protein